VHGEVDDRTLLELVEFIRTHPEGPPLANGAPRMKVDGSRAISHIRRIQDRLEVTLNVNDYQGERVIVEERNGRWWIVKRNLWIV
jgi:hypothetical protein